MSDRTNEFGQPIGPALESWTAPSAPPREAIQGRTCRLEPLDIAKHADALSASFAAEGDARAWTYLPYGPFVDGQALAEWLTAFCLGGDPLFFAVVDARSSSAVGMTSLMRITPAMGVLEIGHLHYGPAMQRGVTATEATYLLLRRSFELGYRRVEWKCDALHASSRAAALRLGFTFEGIFRQAVVYKHRSRDTAWYAITDRDWPQIDAAYRCWLAPSNFDASGGQRERLHARDASPL